MRKKNRKLIYPDLPSPGGNRQVNLIKYIQEFDKRNSLKPGLAYNIYGTEVKV